MKFYSNQLHGELEHYHFLILLHGIVIIFVADSDECTLGNGGCSHICTNTDGSYSCGCPSGFKLGLDGRTCHG